MCSPWTTGTLCRGKHCSVEPGRQRGKAAARIRLENYWKYFWWKSLWKGKRKNLLKSQGDYEFKRLKGFPFKWEEKKQDGHPPHLTWWVWRTKPIFPSALATDCETLLRIWRRQTWGQSIKEKYNICKKWRFQNGSFCISKIYPASADVSPSIDIYAHKTFKTFELILMFIQTIICVMTTWSVQ